MGEHPKIPSRDAGPMVHASKEKRCSFVVRQLHRPSPVAYTAVAQMVRTLVVLLLIGLEEAGARAA
jgi:hypothetical protein